MSPHAAAALMRLAFATTESEADDILDDFTGRGGSREERDRARHLWRDMLARSVTRVAAA